MSDKAIKATVKKPVAPSTPVSQQQQSEIKKFLIIAISVTTLVVLVGGYGIYQLVNLNLKKAREITAQDAYIKMAEQRIAAIPAAEEALTKSKESSNGKTSDFDLITKRALPDSPDFATNITIMSELQKQTGIEITSISNGLKDSASGQSGTTAVPTTTTDTATGESSETSAEAQSYPVSLKISSKYNQLIDFISKIEQSARVFDFSSMKISGTADILTLDMDYNTYYVKPVTIDSQIVPLEVYLEAVKTDMEHYDK